MPELPEVETIRLQLLKLIVGLTIKDIKVLNKKSFIGEKMWIFGEKVIGIRRFGKILVIDLSNGLSLAVHLKMSGQLIYQGDRAKGKEERSETLPDKHTRVIVDFGSKGTLYFNDMRKFGWIKVVSDKQQTTNNKKQKFKDINIERLEDIICNFGPDPLRELTQENFNEILSYSKRPIKLLLMDQGKIAGIGNIYANEALFLSGIHPQKKSSDISNRQAIKLFSSIKKVLKQGIKLGGASSNLYKDAFGNKGRVQEYFYVYGREGEKCLKCKEIIKKIKLGGRGTYFCPKCQALL